MNFSNINIYLKYLKINFSNINIDLKYLIMDYIYTKESILKLLINELKWIFNLTKNILFFKEKSNIHKVYLECSSTQFCCSKYILHTYKRYGNQITLYDKPNELLKNINKYKRNIKY